MKHKWLYLSGCFVAPHIMLVIGLMFLAKKNLEFKSFGFKLCHLSTIVLIVGSLAYYVFLSPILGFD